MWTRKNNTWLFKKEEVNIWDKFWMLTIIKEWAPRWVSKSRPNWYRYFTCECECWNILDCNYSRIKTWRAKSCWCYAYKKASERLIWNKIWVWRTHTDETRKKMRRWNVALMELKQSIRQCFQYSKWRKEVFERDNYTCQVSWIKSSWDLEAHHLEPLMSLIKRFNIETVYDAMECEWMWDVNNWITLNKVIHNNFHKQYWFWNNTEEQFNEFKNAC